MKIMPIRKTLKVFQKRDRSKTYAPDGTSSVVTGMVVESSGSGVSEDGLLAAGGEVDGLDDLIDLVVLLAQLLESLGPGLFSGALENRQG